MEDTFARKVGKFAIACMNKRDNGTIILGVLDVKMDGKEHGTIAGVPLARQHRYLVPEWMDKYFFSNDPVLFRNASEFFKQAIR